MNVKGSKFTDLDHHVKKLHRLFENFRAGVRLMGNYERNEREQSRENQSNSTFANRLEVRISFKTNEIMFKDFANNDEQAHSIITSRLEALLFIVDLY